MANYDPRKIEKKWQKKWETEAIKAEDNSNKPKYYCLVEFPYPSGDGLHVGHTRSYTAMDVLARKRRMEGYNVLYPMGWDAFGLPTENFAIKTKTHPKDVTKKNTDNFRRQLKSIGYSFDWDREINTTDPKYYKWTQWIFLQLYKNGLAYKKKMPINWCLSCKTGLANEEVVDGKCERCGSGVEKREKEQWMLAITKYADRLIKDLDDVDYLEKIKIQQKNWIGKSEGTIIKFSVIGSQSSANSIEVFTTRVDTIFGCTYVVIAPEHEIISNLKSQISNFNEVENYIKQSKKKSEIERTAEEKEKTGVELKGIKAINPFNGDEVSVFVADYVLAYYGTGAVMAVPAHDKRDFEFAKKYNLPIKKVILPPALLNIPRNEKDFAVGAKQEMRVEVECFVLDGILVNSDTFNGLTSEKACEKMTKWLEKNEKGKRQVNYKLRDWIFSRQHYWGEPIPLVNCEKCASTGSARDGIVPVDEKDLPVELPDVKNYEPAETGESPLAKIEKWVNVKCPKCGGPAKRETDTMPNWAGSSWYFLRYIDPENNNELASQNKLKYWMPVDWYNGGMEHTTLHLLYSRFWNKFLYDIKVVPFSEPYKKRTSHGMILGNDGEKMSKSRGNVVNPDDMVNNFGADAYRVYQMFMGPFDQAIPWDPHGIVGAERFLFKVWKLITKVKPLQENKKIKILLNKTIKKITEDVESFSFNTAISSFMILVNELEKEEKISVTDYKLLITLLSPFAPHIAEEIWSKLGNENSVFLESWPIYDKDNLIEDTFNLVIQVNGKVRDTVEVKVGMCQEEAKDLTLKRENVTNYIGNKAIKKVIFVPNKLINIVV